MEDRSEDAALLSISASAIVLRAACIRARRALKDLIYLSARRKVARTNIIKTRCSRLISNGRLLGRIRDSRAGKLYLYAFPGAMRATQCASRRMSIEQTAVQSATGLEIHSSNAVTLPAVAHVRIIRALYVCFKFVAAGIRARARVPANRIARANGCVNVVQY